MEHFVERCEGHGIVIRQCACPSLFKDLVRVPCPEAEWHDRQVVKDLEMQAFLLYRTMVEEEQNDPLH